MKTRIVAIHPDDGFKEKGMPEVCYLKGDGKTVVFKYKKGRRKEVPYHEIK